MRTFSELRMIVATLSAAIITKLILEQIATATLTDLSWPKNNVRMISLTVIGIWIILAERGSALERYAKNNKIKFICEFSHFVRPATPLALAFFIALYLPHPMLWLMCSMGYTLHRITVATHSTRATRQEILQSLGFGNSTPVAEDCSRAAFRGATPALALVTLAAGALLFMRMGFSRSTLSDMPLVIASALAAGQFAAKQPRNPAPQ